MKALGGVLGGFPFSCCTFFTLYHFFQLLHQVYVCLSWKSITESFSSVNLLLIAIRVENFIVFLGISSLLSASNDTQL